MKIKLYIQEGEAHLHLHCSKSAKHSLLKQNPLRKSSISGVSPQ